MVKMDETDAASADNKNLIINYLPQSLSDDVFYEMFSSIGAIHSCRIMRNMQTGYSFGYGFVQYVDPSNADKAIATLDGHAVLNKKIKVSFARPPGQDIKDTNLYIQNLPKNIDESYLTNLFAPYGKIVQSRLLLDKITNLPRGIAFVRYSKRDEAKAAIDALNQKIPDGGTLTLNVKVAEDYSKTKQMYMAQHAMAMGMGGMPPYVGDGRGGGGRGQLRGGVRGRGAGRGGAPRMPGPAATQEVAAPTAGFPGVRPPRAFYGTGGGYTTAAQATAQVPAHDPSTTAGSGHYAGYSAVDADYSGGYGDYSADTTDYSGYTGGYGSAPGMADYYGPDAAAAAAGYAAGYGAPAARGAPAAARGQNRRGGRGGFSKAMPFKTNNRFNPMGAGF